MSAIFRQLNTRENTAELLRIAETGDVDETLRLLPRIDDVNARNRHGMTALMKAAFYGHEPLVRTLLEHGADPNLTRNDRFTALALAAFFGHAETVKTLIEFGARTEAVTRAGASAKTWAKARTFDEVARCLETHSPTPLRAVTVTPTPVVSHPPTPVAVTSHVVKTLKDPPEIWDLVHEVPRSFNPRSAFFARITSMKGTLALGACAVVLLIVGGGVGALMLRSSHARDLQPEIPTIPVAAETTVSRPAPAQPEVESPPVEVVNDNHAHTIPNKARLMIRQPRTAVPVASEAPSETAESREAPAVATPQIESPKPSQSVLKTNPNTALSPHLITPAKNAPPKGKVIQWP
jgi:hypothetical protein